MGQEKEELIQKIMVLLHPGSQYYLSPRTRKSCHFFNNKFGIMYWNDKKHKRKLIKTKGDTLIQNKLEKNKTLYFWGEWEPPSIFHILNNSTNQNHLPHHVHTPILTGNGKQNTDPFVFGDQFLYSNCRQSSRNSKLKYLEKGSIILFGSNKQEKFLLDTLFVVQDSIKINKSNLKEIKIRTPETFHKTVLEKINIENNYRLYFSATYKKPYNEMYSFFPCKTEDPKDFSRPIIKYKGIKNKAQNFYEIENSDNFYKEIVKQVKDQGCGLGVRAELPKSLENKLSN